MSTTRGIVLTSRHRAGPSRCRSVGAMPSDAVRPASSPGVGDRGGGRVRAAASAAPSSTRRWPAAGSSTGRSTPPARWPTASSWWCRPDDADAAEPAVDAVVAGGATRSESVRAGLAAVPADAAVVLVHDGARPLASPRPVPVGGRRRPGRGRRGRAGRGGGRHRHRPPRRARSTATACGRSRRRRASGPPRCAPCTPPGPRPPTTPRWWSPEVAGCGSCRASAGTSRSPSPTTSLVAEALLEQR